MTDYIDGETVEVVPAQPNAVMREAYPWDCLTCGESLTDDEAENHTCSAC